MAAAAAAAARLDSAAEVLWVGLPALPVVFGFAIDPTVYSEWLAEPRASPALVAAGTELENGQLVVLEVAYLSEASNSNGSLVNLSQVRSKLESVVELQWAVVAALGWAELAVVAWLGWVLEELQAVLEAHEQAEAGFAA